MPYRLTVRQGPKVSRHSFDELNDAVTSLREHAEAIREEGRLEPVKMLRSFEPSEMVAGRLEISTGGFFRRGKDAGVDVMGDGSLVAYAGGTKRTELRPKGNDDEFDAVEKALR